MEGTELAALVKELQAAVKDLQEDRFINCLRPLGTAADREARENMEDYWRHIGYADLM